MSTHRRGVGRVGADVAIVGGGFAGLHTARLLAMRGMKVVLVERQRIGWGASGRNGGGVRMQWSTEQNVRLMQQSIELCKSFAQEIGVNVWFRQGGYLFLAKSERERPLMFKVASAERVKRVPRAWDKAFEVNAGDNEAVRASCVELVLAGLYASDRISRSQRHGRITYEIK